jgi:hypothetical protein
MGAQTAEAVSTASSTASSTVVSEVSRLRVQLERAQGRRLDAPVFPVLPALSSLLPGGGLRAGAAYTLDASMSLLLALLAKPTQEGSWCAVVGMPELGAEAAAQMGVDLGRLVLVPEPGPRWLAVAATLADVLPVVAIRPTGRTSAAEASRLAARLRDRSGVLLVQGEWSQAEAALAVDSSEWTGLGDGHGNLRARTVTVSVRSRRRPTPRRARMLLPDGSGAGVGMGSRAGGAWLDESERMRAVG